MIILQEDFSNCKTFLIKKIKYKNFAYLEIFSLNFQVNRLKKTLQMPIAFFMKDFIA